MLWTQAGTVDCDPVRDALIGPKVPNLTGGTTELVPNHHLTKPVLLGEIKADGQFDSISPTEPVPGDACTDDLPESAALLSDWQTLQCGMSTKDTKTCVEMKSNC